MGLWLKKSYLEGCSLFKKLFRAFISVIFISVFLFFSFYFGSEHSLLLRDTDFVYKDHQAIYMVLLHQKCWDPMIYLHEDKICSGDTVKSWSG